MIQNDMFNDDALHIDELEARCTPVNELAVNSDTGEYIIVFLRRSLRAYDNPVIDVAIAHSQALKLPIVVYTELSFDEPYACDRLHYFVLGANQELSTQLRKRGIQHIFAIRRDVNDDDSTLATLLKKAAMICVDEHFTQYEKNQSCALAANFTGKVLEVDASRLIPHSALSGSLHVTKSFRAAHSSYREKWFNLRSDKLYTGSELVVELNNACEIHRLSDSGLLALIAQSSIDHSVTISLEHPPTAKELNKRLKVLVKSVAPGYRAQRNNPALAFSTSQLSPYLHFGMTSPWEIMRAVNASNITKSAIWKFYDELFTWREWSHWRLAKRPDFISYSSLPNSVIKTLAAHADDPRELILTEEQLYNGDTPDDTWNAAQRMWRDTGWLHNNLRMYWAKQFLRWTRTPQEAFNLACKFNDKQSLDGLDPATYVSMRWAFGESKPAYKEHDIYGWVAKRGDRALLKRDGFIKWRDAILNTQ